MNTRTKQSFTYDRVFPEWSSNEDVFENIAKPLVFNALNGVNSTIFAYGQTSSGKTFTIRGNAENPGIIPLTVREIFEVIRSRTDREYCLKVSYLEVYNEQVNDLLDPSKTNLDIRERLDKGVYVERLSEYTISSYDEAIRLLVTGEANRKIGETSMNVQSSRSHTVFRISIESTGPHDDGKILMSQLNLVDLAGSEGVQQTKAENLRLREGSNINKSLLSLSTVIQKLSEAGGKGGAFVNYRDSKMTRLLQPALSGNSKTSVVCNVTPAITFFQETNNTLQFGAKAKRIKTNAKVNEVMNSESHLKTMQDELKKLQGRVEELNEILGNKNLELQRIREQETEKDSYHFAIVEKIENDNENLKQALIEKELQLKELQSRILNSGRPSQASWTTPASCEERRSRVQSSLIKSRKIKHNQAIETNDYIEALESLVMERDDTISKLQNELKNIKLNYEDKFQQLLMESEMFSEEIQNHCEPFDISSLQDTINSLELEKASLLFQLDELSIHKDRQLETISQENSVLKENINLLNNKIEEHTRRDQILELTKLERDYQNLMNVLDSKEIERAERESLINNLSEKCSILMEKFEAETRKTHDYELQIQETKNEFAKYVNMELELREMKDMAMAAIGHVENQQNINHQLKEDHQKDLEKLESELRYIYEYNEKQQNQHKDSYNNLELQLNTELSKNHALENELQLIRIKYAEEVECLNLKIMSLTNDIKILIEENARINEKVTDCTQDLKSENERLLNINCEMETQIKVLNQDKSGFQQQIYSLEINIKDLNTENSLLLSKITETQSRATDQFNFLNDVTGLLEQTQAEISQLKIEKSEFEALYTTSQAQLDELSDLLARVSEEKDKLESENAEAKQSFEEISSKKEFAETQLSEVKQAYEQLIAENSSIVIKLEELEQSHGNNNFDNLQTKLDHYMQENSSLNQNLIEKDIENSKLKEDFYKFQQETLNKSNEKYKGRISDLRGQIDH